MPVPHAKSEYVTHGRRRVRQKHAGVSVGIRGHGTDADGVHQRANRLSAAHFSVRSCSQRNVTPRLNLGEFAGISVWTTRCGDRVRRAAPLQPGGILEDSIASTIVDHHCSSSSPAVLRVCARFASRAAEIVAEDVPERLELLAGQLRVPRARTTSPSRCTAALSAIPDTCSTRGVGQRARR